MKRGRRKFPDLLLKLLWFLSWLLLRIARNRLLQLSGADAMVYISHLSLWLISSTVAQTQCFQFHLWNRSNLQKAHLRITSPSSWAREKQMSYSSLTSLCMQKKQSSVVLLMQSLRILETTIGSMSWRFLPSKVCSKLTIVPSSTWSSWL